MSGELVLHVEIQFDSYYLVLSNQIVLRMTPKVVPKQTKQTKSTKDSNKYKDILKLIDLLNL